jgi:hypothetical protein
LLALGQECTSSCNGCVIWAPNGPRWDSGGPSMPASAHSSPSTRHGRTRPGRLPGACSEKARHCGHFSTSQAWKRQITSRSAHRFGVLWRKRSQGTCSEKGNRWVERVLSLHHTCRIRGRPMFPLLVDAVSGLFKGEMPDLSWLTRHESRPVFSTP